MNRSHRSFESGATPIFSPSLEERGRGCKKEGGKERKRAAMCEAIFCCPEAIFPFVRPFVRSFVLRRQQHKMAKRKRLKCKRSPSQQLNKRHRPKTSKRHKKRKNSQFASESDAKNPHSPHHEFLLFRGKMGGRRRGRQRFFPPSISICRPQPLPFIARRTRERTKGRGEERNTAATGRGSSFVTRFP